MPDTHLVMPRTLSAPDAGLLEAEAPQTTTASDAPPNGTAAAAAAFARLLASGDHAMQPERSPITEPPADHYPHGGETHHRPDVLRAMLLGTTTIPSVGMTFQQAADRVQEMMEWANSRPRGEDDGIDDKAELERREAARNADCREWSRILDAMMSTPAQTVGDLLAKVERLSCPSLGIRQMEYLETEVLVLREDVKRLRPLLTGFDLSVPADAGIFTAYNRWSQLARDCRAAKADEDVERLSEQADRAALHLMTHEPATAHGLAAQVFVMLHLEHGGTTDDAIDIDFSSMCGVLDSPHAVAVRALVERVKRLGRRDRAETPLETPSMAVSTQVDNAMRRFCQECGLTQQHREWLEKDLADAFSDTVAAFEAEAPETLALPLEPTGRMIDAGASAAGITPAQFQAAYAAAVEALKLERVA